MSRIAKYPVVVPSGVEVTLSAGEITVKGPLGSLTQVLHPSVAVAKEGERVQVSAVAGAENAKALSGTVRALVNNMVLGVTKGFERKLNLVGVGYRAQAQGDKLNLSLGYSASGRVHEMPQGIKLKPPCRPRSSSKVSTSRRSVRLPLKFAPIVSRSPIRARVCGMPTRW